MSSDLKNLTKMFESAGNKYSQKINVNDDKIVVYFKPSATTDTVEFVFDALGKIVSIDVLEC